MKTMKIWLNQVGELSPSPNAMKRLTRGINEHWKPVYLNCAPCNEDYQAKYFDFFLMFFLLFWAVTKLFVLMKIGIFNYHITKYKS